MAPKPKGGGGCFRIFLIVWVSLLLLALVFSHSLVPGAPAEDEDADIGDEEDAEGADVDRFDETESDAPAAKGSGVSAQTGASERQEDSENAEEEEEEEEEEQEEQEAPRPKARSLLRKGAEPQAQEGGAAPPSRARRKPAQAQSPSQGGGSGRPSVVGPPVGPRFKEDNAPRKPPRKGDVDKPSQVPDILDGTDSNHMHGRVGLTKAGEPRIRPTPLPDGGQSAKDKKDAHRGFCFNSKVSDSISLDRPQKDVRTPACRERHKKYPRDLPATSIVMVFHNENLSVLLRSLHSVLNHTPPKLLKEIILIDDASMIDDKRFYTRHWLRLQNELEDYVTHLPKVRLVRLKERRGIMVARMEGIWRATGEVTIFLDSHIECTPGWIEPLLARIKEDPTHVVVPSIDSVGNDDFVYHVGGGLGVLAFSWALGQSPTQENTGPDGTQVVKSPVMAGGIFATNTNMFLKLGGYDDEMRLYGGEEMEIGFRTWMCGGDIEYVPCSHVGHVFRTPAYWQGQVYRVPGEEINRNKLRTAEVWMDEYKTLVQLASSPLPPEVPMGDVSNRRELRQKLGCKDFSWYLKHVTPNLFVPKLNKDALAGALQNKMLSACVDTLGESTDGAPVGLYPCHGQHGTQAMIVDGQGLVRLPQLGYQKCIALEGKEAVIASCDKKNHKLQWEYDHDSGQMSHDGKCLEASMEKTQKSPYTLLVSSCKAKKELQSWKWQA